jgi:phosphate uptake regulator
MLHAAHAEQDALTLLAFQAPVAGDLRGVVASLKNVADAERMCALALHVAKIVRRLDDAVSGRTALLDNLDGPRFRCSLVVNVGWR